MQRNCLYSEQLVSAGIRITKEAISEAQAELGENAQPMYSALDIGSLGKLLKPLEKLPLKTLTTPLKSSRRRRAGRC